MRTIPLAVFMTLLFANMCFGQANDPNTSEPVAESPAAIPLEVPVGTPLPVVLDQEVRIRKTGQPIHGKIAEPVYAFDKLVVPAGSEVTGSVTRISGVSAAETHACRRWTRIFLRPAMLRSLSINSCCPMAAASRFTRKSPPRRKEFYNSQPRRKRRTPARKAKRARPKNLRPAKPPRQKKKSAGNGKQRKNKWLLPEKCTA